MLRTWGPDLLILMVAIAAFFVLPTDLAFLTKMVITIIFVISIDLILGYAGIATLGQVAMYGTGAYAAAILVDSGVGDPLVGLFVGALAGAFIAFISGLLLMRTHGLTLLMLSIAVAFILREIANKASHWTGGADGKSIWMDPIFGRFQFDLYGQTAYIYATSCLVILFVIAKIITRSNFGLACQGIRESSDRMHAIGTPVYWRLVTIYTIAGTYAGIAGALAAQTTEVVSLESYSFPFSAEAVVMLILGGTGRLYGAILGTILFMTVHHIAAANDPANWLFVIGAMVLGVVFFAPSGLMTFAEALKRKPS